MTITINRWTAVLAIAIVGVLAGLALGRVTEADSAPTATVSSQAEASLKAIAKETRAISLTLGQSAGVYTILKEVEKIAANTGG